MVFVTYANAENNDKKNIHFFEIQHSTACLNLPAN